MTATKNTKAFYNTEIPGDWEVAGLGEICNKFLNGGTPSTQIEDYWKGNIPWVTGADIIEQRIPEVRRYISDKAVKESSTNVIPKGNLLLVTRTGVGKLTVTPFDVAISQDLTGLLLKEKVIDTQFAFYFFDGNERLLKQLNQGTSISGITRSVLEAFKIPLPPLPEQKAIAQVLSTADATIHTAEKLIALKELRKKWLMQQLLTGKKRLKGFEGEWKENKLEFFIKDYKQKPTDEDNYEVLTSAKAGLMKQTDYYGDNRITNRDDADYNVIPPNYLTYRSRSDDGLFTFNKNDLGITGLISGYYPVFTIKNGDINFILMYMNYYRQNLTKYAIGTSQLVLAMNALKEAKFHLPKEDEQTAIAQVLQAADKEISLLKAKAEKLREQKKGLMQVLLTGKVRLKI